LKFPGARKHTNPDMIQTVFFVLGAFPARSAGNRAIRSNSSAPCGASGISTPIPCAGTVAGVCANQNRFVVFYLRANSANEKTIGFFVPAWDKILRIHRGGHGVSRKKTGYVTKNSAFLRVTLRLFFFFVKPCRVFMFMRLSILGKGRTTSRSDTMKRRGTHSLRGSVCP
jgi:hypothetical protein